jgi:hypothetical protein
MKNTIGNGITLASTPMYETSDYSMFKIMLGNRVIDTKRVDRIVNNIQEVGLIHAPIIVNEKFEVIDGQHRLEACKRLNLPVYYVIERGADIGTCVTMNRIPSTWKEVDFIHLYAANGDKNYQALSNLIVEFNDAIPRAIIIAVAAGLSSEAIKQAKKGTFTLVKSEDEIREDLEYLRSVSGIVPVKRSYLEAIYAVAIRYAIVDKKMLRKKLMDAPIKLPRTTARDATLDALSALVNYRSRSASIDLKTEYKNRLKKDGLSPISDEKAKARKDKVSEASYRAATVSLFSGVAP